MPISQVTIVNPELGDPFTIRRDPYTGNLAGELSVPIGWGFYFEPQEAGDPAWKHRRPEYVRYSHWAKMFVTSGTMRAGLVQRVPVTPGDKLSLNVDACFTSTNAGIALRVGIDPLGEADYKSAAIAWGPWQGETSQGEAHWDGGLGDQRTLTTPQVEAVGPYVTLFLHAENLYAGKDASAFWDSAVLYRYGGDEEPPPGGDYAELVAAVKDVAAAIRELVLQKASVKRLLW